MLNLQVKTLESGLPLYFIGSASMASLKPGESEKDFRAFGVSCRINALSMIKAAGSGHIGSSFSAIDLILAARLFRQPSNFSDVFFSSKGHDAPGLYAVMNAFGEIPDEQLQNLRTMDGLPGHPEVGVYDIPTSTGSLGMGISKAKGFWYSRNQDDLNVTVLLGDGELQEGQIWESLPGASRDQMSKLLVIVDGNKIQSDTWVEKTLPLGDLRQRVEGCGWLYLECDGHDYFSLKNAFGIINKEAKKPVFLYAHTKKASGVSFMENFDPQGSFYKYHSGSPSDLDYLKAIKELVESLEITTNPKFPEDIEITRDENVGIPDDFSPKVRNQSLIQVWADILEELFKADSNLIALDADLSYDTGTYKVARSAKNQYIQCGIAEQDMVSIAGALALNKKIPFVHSFASFLTTRAAEQIFNNLSENSKVIYCGFLAGLLPSAPGHSHQAVSDVGIIASFPNIEIYEPACEAELKMFKELIHKTDKSIYLRIGSVDLPVSAGLNEVKIGRLTQRRSGGDVAIVTAGPSMTKIALEVSDLESPMKISVFTYPTIGRELTNADKEILSNYKKIVVLENHLPALCIYENLKSSFSKSKIEVDVIRIGVNELPRNGRTNEVLIHHGMDITSIKKVLDF